MTRLRCLRLLIALSAAWPAAAQTPATAPQPQLTLENVLKRRATLQRPMPRVLWSPDMATAAVVQTAADGSQALHRLAEGAVEAEPMLTAAALRQLLGDAEAKGPARFPELAWVDANTLRVQVGTRVVHVTPGGEAKTVLEWIDDPAADPVQTAVAPGDAHVAHVREHQLWLTGADGRTRQLTFDGSADIAYGTAAHRAEFGIAGGLFWSADGRWLAFTREDLRPIAPYPFQDVAASQPAPLSGRYPMAGTTHSRVRVGVCDTADGSVRWLEGDPDEDVYWTNLAFDGLGHVVVARVARSQDHLELVQYDVATGRRLATLLEERDAEWIEPQHPPAFLPDGRFLWWSPRSGHWHLWLCGADGKELHQVTKGAFDVQELLGVDREGAMVWFAASGEDPRQCHLFAAALDGSEIRQVTRERGTHRAVLSPDCTSACVVWSNLETPPSARLVDLRSGAVIPLPMPPDPLAEFALPAQRMFTVKTDDDVVLYGHLALPPDLAEGQKCPVLVYVYGGPHVQLVTDQWFGGAPVWLQAFAAEGFVVCRLDNRGTPHRGIEFEQSVFRRLGVLEVQDQLRAVDWLAQQPFVDKERIGVHGWSFGGYMTLRLMLAAPTTFACGVSGAPVTDWGLYETGYTERYMDLPAENADGYSLSSCLPFAAQLQRPLLIAHGTDDRTVVPAHSLQFVDRCIDAGKQLEDFPYPMQKHGLVGQDRVHFLVMLRDWLVRHLRPEVRG